MPPNAERRPPAGGGVPDDARGGDDITVSVADRAVSGRTCAWCRGPLPPRRKRFCSDLCRVRGQRSERRTETGEFGRAAIRMIRHMARRVGASDIAEFGAMWEVMTEAEHAVTDAIDALRESGFSWAEVGAEVGWSKQRIAQWRQRRGEFHRQQSVDAGTADSGVAG